MEIMPEEVVWRIRPVCVEVSQSCSRHIVHGDGSAWNEDLRDSTRQARAHDAPREGVTGTPEANRLTRRTPLCFGTRRLARTESR
jgi:hypothetical protein